MEYYYIIFIFNLIYEIPSFILLIIVELVLLLPSNNKLFYSSFFKIILFNGGFDILSFITYTIHHRLPNYGILADFYNYLSIQKFDVRVIEYLRSLSTTAQLIGTFFLCLNRFTSVYFHVNYEFIWKYLLPLYYVVVVTFPSVSMFPILIDKMVYKPFNSSNINLGFKGRWATFNGRWYNSYIISMIITLTFLTLCAIINFSTLLLLFKYKKKSVTKVHDGIFQQKLNYSMEKKFFTLALVYFFGQIIVAACNFIVNKFSTNKEYDKLYIMTLLFPVLNDISTFPNIWLLIIISSNIRNSIKELFCIKNTDKTQSFKIFHSVRHKNT